MNVWNSEVRNFTRQNIDIKNMRHGLVLLVDSEDYWRTGTWCKHICSAAQEDGVVAAGHNIDLVLQLPAFKNESDTQTTKDQ